MPGNYCQKHAIEGVNENKLMKDLTICTRIDGYFTECDKCKEKAAWKIV